MIVSKFYISIDNKIKKRENKKRDLFMAKPFQKSRIYDFFWLPAFIL